MDALNFNIHVALNALIFLYGPESDGQISDIFVKVWHWG